MSDQRDDSPGTKRWGMRRVGGVAGILFVASVVVAPDPSVREGSSPDRIRQFYLDNRQALGLMLILTAIAYVLFLYFSIVLQRETQRKGTSSDSMATLLLMSTVLISAFYVLGAALRVVPATAAEAGASGVLMESVFHITNTVNDGLIKVGTYWRGAMLASAAILILQTRTVSRPVGWFAAILAVGSFVGGFSFVESPLDSVFGAVGYASFLLFHLWVLVVSVVLVLGRDRGRSGGLRTKDADPAPARR